MLFEHTALRTNLIRLFLFSLGSEQNHLKPKQKAIKLRLVPEEAREVY